VLFSTYIQYFSYYLLKTMQQKQFWKLIIIQMYMEYAN
jgi:hypothetical protein